MASGTEETPRHSSWLELFFDLIVVAGAGQLAHLLHGEPGWSDVGLYALLYLAFWIAWVLFTMYGNVAGEQVRTGRVILGMFGMVVMAAAVAGVHESEQKAVAFAAAYVGVRILGAKFWGGRKGRLAVDLPIAQYGMGLTPWIVSFWVPDDWRIWCWALGLAIDVAILMFISREDIERRMNERWARFQERWLRFQTRSAERETRQRHPSGLPASERRHHDRDPDRRGRRGLEMPPKPIMVAADEEHLSERLGLFVIVVLGEGVIQIVTAASGITWDARVYVVAGCSFVILVSLWWLALQRGDNGLPLLGRGALPVRLSLGLHSVFTGGLVALSIVLGEAVTESGTTMGQPQRLLALGAVALCLGVLVVCGLASRELPARVLGTVVPPAAVLFALALIDGEARAVVFVPALTLTVLWPALLRKGLERAGTTSVG